MADEQKQNNSSDLSTEKNIVQEQADGKGSIDESLEISSLENELKAIIKEAQDDGERFDKPAVMSPALPVLPERPVMKTEQVQEPVSSEVSIPVKPEDLQNVKISEEESGSDEKVVPEVKEQSSVEAQVQPVVTQDVLAPKSESIKIEDKNYKVEEKPVETQSVVSVPTHKTAVLDMSKAPPEDQPIFIPVSDEVVDLTKVSLSNKDWDIKDAPVPKKEINEISPVESKIDNSNGVSEHVSLPDKPEMAVHGDDELDRQLKELGVLTPEGKPALRDAPTKPPPTVSYRTSEYVAPAPKIKVSRGSSLTLALLILLTVMFTTIIVLAILARQGYNIPFVSRFVQPTVDKIITSPPDRYDIKEPEASSSGSIVIPVASSSASPFSSSSATPSSGFLGGTQSSPSGIKF